MLRDEHVSITTDVSTSSANDSYHRAVGIGVSFEDSTTGEDLAHAIESMVMHHNPAGCLITCTTDCEPSMVRVSCLLQDRKVWKHHLYCLDGPGVKKPIALSRALVKLESKSGKVADRLDGMGLTEMLPNGLKVV